MNAKQLLSRAFGVFFVKVIFVGLGFLSTLILARLYTTKELGFYFWLLSCITFLCVAMRFGQENTLIKQAANSSTCKQKSAVTSQALFIVCRVTLAVAVGMLLVTFFFQETLSVNLVMLVNAFMFSIISIIGYCMQAAGQSVMQQLLLNTPRLLCAGLAIAFFLVFKYLAPLQTMLTAAFFISFIFTLALFYFKGFVIKYAPFKLLTNPSETKHYLLISCSAVLMAEGAMVILGMLGSEFDTAHFGVATRLVSLVAFVLLAFNSIVTPQFAQLYKQNKHKELVKRYQSARQQSIFISMSIALVFWWSADFLLGLFGTEYVQASGVMLVLLLTQLTKVFVGSAGQLLMMSDLVHLQKRCIVAGVLVMILGCCIFIPQYGALGAAISTFIGVAINNFLALFYANRYLSIPLGLASSQ